MQLKYTECPRDSWQGLDKFIPTPQKIAYIQKLIDAGFKDIDMGSFVSPKAVPQLADTEEVLAELKPKKDTNLLAIIANLRGLERALKAKNLKSVGYPFSVNERFQKQNTNKSLVQSWDIVKEMKESSQGELELIVYISMGFGNPYNDAWKPVDTARMVGRLRDLEITKIALADTVGTANAEILESVLKEIEEPQDLGLHLHAKPNNWQEPIEKARAYSISWFEGAFAGIGGCPFADDDLVGNLPTEVLLPFLAKNFDIAIQKDNLQDLADKAAEIALNYS